ncbi:MAG: hypothetical protein LWX83_19040 [Anaerolineae bacterium]|nr:hypothetical protein [Anaerolineae bacterium]
MAAAKACLRRTSAQTGPAGFSAVAVAASVGTSVRELPWVEQPAPL